MEKSTILTRTKEARTSSCALDSLPCVLHQMILSYLSLQFRCETYVLLSKQFHRPTFISKHYLTLDAATTGSSVIPIPRHLCHILPRIQHVHITRRWLDELRFDVDSVNKHDDNTQNLKMKQLISLSLVQSAPSRTTWTNFMAILLWSAPSPSIGGKVTGCVLQHLSLCKSLPHETDTEGCCDLIAHHCPQLRHLDINGCPLTDASIESLTSLMELTSLHMDWSVGCVNGIFRGSTTNKSLSCLLNRDHGQRDLQSLSIACRDSAGLASLINASHLKWLSVSFIHGDIPIIHRVGRSSKSWAPIRILDELHLNLCGARIAELHIPCHSLHVNVTSIASRQLNKPALANCVSRALSCNDIGQSENLSHVYLHLDAKLPCDYLHLVRLSGYHWHHVQRLEIVEYDATLPLRQLTSVSVDVIDNFINAARMLTDFYFIVRSQIDTHPLHQTQFQSKIEPLFMKHRYKSAHNAHAMHWYRSRDDCYGHYSIGNLCLTAHRPADLVHTT
jgi:hypothetical protein